MPNYQEMIEYRRRTHFKFDQSALAPEFVPYFNSQQRIKVRFEYGEIKTGTVGITGGGNLAFYSCLPKGLLDQAGVCLQKTQS